MAYKDEYEVARLYTNGQFDKRLSESFEGDFKVFYNLAPPLFARRDAHGHLVKARFGPWMKTAFKLLASLRGLRGTAFGECAKGIVVLRGDESALRAC